LISSVILHELVFFFIRLTKTRIEENLNKEKQIVKSSSSNLTVMCCFMITEVVSFLTYKQEILNCMGPSIAAKYSGCFFYKVVLMNGK